MNIIAREKIGTLQLENKVDITDPCYDKGTWCRITEKCEPGIYTGYVEIFDEGEWGKRVASIAIYKDDEISETNMFINEIGVDAGLAGFFRNKPDYPDDKWSEFLHEAGLYKENGEYDYDKEYYQVEYGLFSSSGYGDGSYSVYTNYERTAFKIVFIEEDDNEEY